MKCLVCIDPAYCRVENETVGFRVGYDAAIVNTSGVVTSFSQRDPGVLVGFSASSTQMGNAIKSAIVSEAARQGVTIASGDVVVIGGLL